MSALVARPIGPDELDLFTSFADASPLGLKPPLAMYLDQDGDERVAAATRGTRVGDARQVGEQVRSLGFLERVGIAQRVKTRWDRG